MSRILPMSDNRRDMSSHYKASALPADTPKMNPISGGALPLISLPSAVSSGSAAIASGNQLLNQAAQQIANPDDQDLLDPLTSLSQSTLLAAAGADVIRASNEMLGTLFDTFA